MTTAIVVLCVLAMMGGVGGWRYGRRLIREDKADPWIDEAEDDQGPADTVADLIVPAALEAAAELQMAKWHDDCEADQAAAELHQIGDDARADEWHYDSLAILTRMPDHWRVYGYTTDDWLRCNLPARQYRAEVRKDRDEWRRRVAREERQFRREMGLAPA